MSITISMSKTGLDDWICVLYLWISYTSCTIDQTPGTLWWTRCSKNYSSKRRSYSERRRGDIQIVHNNLMYLPHVVLKCHSNVTVSGWECVKVFVSAVKDKFLSLFWDRQGSISYLIISQLLTVHSWVSLHSWGKELNLWLWLELIWNDVLQSIQCDMTRGSVWAGKCGTPPVTEGTLWPECWDSFPLVALWEPSWLWHGSTVHTANPPAWRHYKGNTTHENQQRAEETSFERHRWLK